MSENYEKDNTKAFIMFGFLGIFTIMLLAMWLSMATLNSVNAEMSMLIEDTGQKTARAYQMRDVIRQRSNSIRSLLLINDPVQREKIFEKLVSSTAVYLESRSALESYGANEREQEILDKIALADERVAEVYDKANNKIFNMEHSPDMLTAVLGEVQLQELVLLNHLNDLVKMESTLSGEVLSDSNTAHNRMQKVLLMLGAIASVLSLIIAFVVINRVTSANRKIAHLASHDDLTGLHNRRSFEASLTTTINRARRTSGSYGLLYVDLDRFKIINDTCGHHAGDQLLLQFTKLINSRLRDGDMFARVGGDEFAIIAQGNTFEEVVQLAENLRQLVNGFTFNYAEQTFDISLSIGVIPVDGSVTDIEALLADVDSACYVAKQTGRNRVHITQENDTEVVKYRNDIAGMQNIKHALAEERLTLFHQPVYKIGADGVEMEHCEILLRIRSESGELFSPAEFIPIAEKYNIMTEIDRWVFTNVLDWIEAHQNDYELPRLLINLSGLSFIDEDFLQFVVARLQNGAINNERIAFEITETAAVDNIAKANEFIERIGELGCRFALDDFGSGFSTFSYLKQLPIDYLKIDGSLVKNLANDNIDREMVKAINEIGHTVGAKTIAEFVEDDQTLEYLRSIGVDYAQGYGLAKPSALDDLVHKLAEKSQSTRKFKKAS